MKQLLLRLTLVLLAAGNVALGQAADPAPKADAAKPGAADPADDATWLVKVDVTFADGAMSCQVENHRIVIELRTFMLNEVSAIEITGADQATVTLRNGLKISGGYHGPKTVACRFGGTVGTVNLSAARRIVVTPLQPREPAPAQPAVALPVIEPPKLVGKVSRVTLPGPVSDVVAGGGGRYLVMQLKSEAKVVVFDVNTAGIVGSLPLRELGAKIAAGAQCLLVGYPSLHRVERFNLPTLKLEQAAAMPAAAFKSLLLGEASTGPALVDGVTLLDVQTLRPLPARAINAPPRFDEKMGAHASADSRSFVFTEHYNQRDIWLGSLSGRNITWTKGGGHFSACMLNDDGGRLITKYSITTSTMAYLAKVTPAVHLVTVPVRDRWYTVGLRKDGDSSSSSRQGPPRLEVKALDDGRVVFDAGPIPEFLYSDRDVYGQSEGLPIEHRVFHIADAKLLVIIPPPADTLVLRRFDLFEAMTEMDIDCFHVEHPPVRSAAINTTYRSKIDLRSTKPHAHFALEQGPTGMRVSDEGVVEWDVPREARDEMVSVAIRIFNDAGQRIVHRYEIAVHR